MEPEQPLGPGLDHWEGMWGRGLDPGQFFDAARTEPALQRLIDAGALPHGRVLVPGCGRGYAVASLAADPRRDVLGLDFSQTAVAAAQQYLQDKQGRVECGDFFQHSPPEPYDMVYDCTFLCSFHPSRRDDWARQTARLVRPGGVLVTLIYPIGDFEGGPPFALTVPLVRELLDRHGFSEIACEEVPAEMVARTRSGEYIAQWRRR